MVDNRYNGRRPTAKQLLLALGFSCLYCLLSLIPSRAEETYNFRVIVVKHEREAKAILERARAGDPFWRLAIDHSIFPNGPLGGYVEAARPGELRREFQSALTRLSPGKVSDLVVVREGYAILKREAKTSPSMAWKLAEERFIRGLRHGSQGDFDAASKEIRETLKAYPNHLGAQLIAQTIENTKRQTLSKSIAMQVCESALLSREGFPEKALEKLEAAAKAAPKTTEVQTALGEIYLYQGKIDKAIAAYEKALDSATWAVLSHLSLGSLYLQRNDLSRALNHYQKAVALDIGLAPAHLGLGLVYLGLGKHKDAFKEVQVALAIDPHLDPAYNQMGLIMLSHGQIQEAIWAFEKALSIRPNNADYMNHLGFANNRLGMFSKATRILEEAVSLAPNDPLINNNLAIAYYDNGQIEKALYYADKARKLGYKVHKDFLAKLEPYRKARSGARKK